MTIKQLAIDLNTSTMTIYRRLKAHGINVDELRDSDTGELTAAGASTIAALFDSVGTTGSKTDITKPCNAIQQSDATGTQQSATDGDAVQIAVLTTKLEAAAATIANLEAERDRLIDQLAAVTAALEREQNDRQQERRLLTAGPDGSGTGNQQRRGLFSRIFRK